MVAYEDNLMPRYGLMNFECQGITCAPPPPPPHSVSGCEGRFCTRNEIEETPSNLSVREVRDILIVKSDG